MKRKSMSLNVLLNGIKTVFSLLFPLITFPYITRVLSPEGVGQAKAVIFFAIVVVIGMIQLRATRSKEVQQ